MTDRDSTTRTRARTPGEEDYPPSTAVYWRVTDPTLSGIFVDANAMHEGRRQTNTGPAHAGSRLKLSDALGRRRPKCHPSSRTGENPPYGMIGGIEETSASFEARSAPRSYPTWRSETPRPAITAPVRLVREFDENANQSDRRYSAAYRSARSSIDSSEPSSSRTATA